MTISFENLLSMITVGAVIASYGSGVWGIYGHFLTENKPEPAMKLTSLLSLGGLMWFLFDRWQGFQAPAPQVPAFGITPSVVRDGIVLVLLAMSMSVFWWAITTTRQRRLTLAFSNDQPVFIHTAGPYAWVRHPFYTSYIIFWIAAAIGSGSPWFWLMPAVMTIIYWRAIQAEEAKFAMSPISSQYAHYKQQTGMLYPHQIGRRRSGAHP